MNDLEWLNSTDASAMLRFMADFDQLPNIARRLRFVATANCRLLWEHLIDRRSRDAIEMVERLADGPVRLRRLEAYREEAHHVWSFPLRDYYWDWDEFYRLVETYGEALPRIAGEPRRALRGLTMSQMVAARAATVCANPDDPLAAAIDTVTLLSTVVQPILLANIVREVFGNPFAPPVLELAWRSQTVVDLARTIESQLAFPLMPILSDALLDAGCDDDKLIDHCRQTEPHVRGCWLVDAVLQRNR